MDLQVSIERNGIQWRIGRIFGNTQEDACFQYSEEYLNSSDPVAISLSLPLQEEPFSAQRTKRYFEGLLPEGYTRRTVAQWMHADEEDYLSILHGLGRECLGAIQITEDGEKLTASYESISREQIQELAAEGVSKSTEIVTRAHLSLTGASGKVGLYYDKGNDCWYIPWGTAPSTHIIKQSHIRLNDIVTNEQLSLMTAQKCGIEIPESFIINTGNGNENEVLFATARYDRVMANQVTKVDGLPCPNRLHQEDFAQAMGILAAEKYEKKPSGYFRRMFGILRAHSANPIQDQMKLWDIMVFNYLLGNTDAHIKNSSLVYSPDMHSIRLAPAYDLVSTTVYRQSTREMAFYIGDELLIDNISINSFRKAARDAGLSEKIAIDRFDALKAEFQSALELSAEQLSDSGYPRARIIKNDILKTGGISLF